MIAGLWGIELPFLLNKLKGLDSLPVGRNFKNYSRFFRKSMNEYFFRSFQANSEFKYEKNTANKEDELYLEEVYGL